MSTKNKWKATKAVSLLGVYFPGKQMENHKSCFPLFKGYIVQGSKWKATEAVSLLGVYCPGMPMESLKSCFPFRGICPGKQM